MLASGNTVVVNPHPSGRQIAIEGVRRFNQAIQRDLGVDNLISLVAEPTLDTAGELFNHRGVKLICVTGGPAVAREHFSPANEQSSRVPKPSGRC